MAKVLYSRRDNNYVKTVDPSTTYEYILLRWRQRIKYCGSFSFRLKEVCEEVSGDSVFFINHTVIPYGLLF